MKQKMFKSFILYTAAFFASLYLHKGTLLLYDGYLMYYAAFIVSWAISSLVSRKFKNKGEYKFTNKLYSFTVSFFLMLGILTFIFYNFDLIGVSRFVILSSLIISFSIEISYLLYKNKDKFSLKRIDIVYSSKAFTFDIILFGILNLYIIYQLTGNLSFDIQNFILFISMYLSWFVGAFWGYQFHPRHMSKDYWAFIWQYLKSYIIIFALSTFFGFINRLEINDVMEIIIGIVGYSFLSFIGISIYYYIKQYRSLVLYIAGFPVKGEKGDNLLNEKISNILNKYKTSFNTNDSELMNSKFKNFSLVKYPDVYEFLEKSIDLSLINYVYSSILKSNNISNIDYMPERMLQFFLNLERLNRIPNVNEYLREVNRKLMFNGIFAGCLETVYLRHQKFLKRYPYYFAQSFYFLDFIWNRVFSKTNFLSKIYFWFTGGIQKTFSLAEGMGRLYFSGFEVLNLKIIEDKMFFIAKKIKEPDYNEIPSTGLIFKMKRIGKNGKPIYVYKIRTMHPYSQYLQEFIYQKFSLQDGGKFNNDFRITFWGSILRKLWLDELPMLYNWIKGDLKLFGIRPLSQHYFDLYNTELKEKRLKYKPGLIPPFYVDNPKTLNDIMKSEEKYLDSYDKRPKATDIRYFFLCLHNILFKGARSG